MTPDEIKTALESAIPGSEVQAALDGNHAHVTVISAVFEGLSPVKKQQMVYGVLNDAIASGAIHAVHMSTYTPAEWSSRNP